MFGTYLRRELVNRRRQTLIVAIGMALAIALVLVVNSVAGGVKAAQAVALQSVYGVGTDITVTKATTAADTNGGGQRFQFGSGSGNATGGTRTFTRNRLTVERGVTTFASTAVSTVAKTSGVKAATGVLSLNDTDFTGQIPQAGSGSGSRGGFTPGATRPTGGPDGQGGSAFGVDSFTVLGYDVTGAAIGPLTAATLTSGRALTAADSGKDVAVLDSDYATSAKKKVGGTISVGGTTFTVVGVVKSTSATGASGSNVYIPLATAQKLATQTGKVSSVYVEAASANDIGGVKTALQKTLGSAMTVNTEADLASSVTGSLGTASSLANSLGLWLSILVLAAAFLLAVLFTVSGVTRRTREFGTLKAIGWSNRRIVGQVAGESIVQGVLGGVIGLAVGLVAILVVNIVHPTLTAGTATVGRTLAGGFGGGAPGAAPGGFGEGGGFGRAAAAATTTAAQIALTLPVTAWVVLLAVGLAVLGGVIAGAFGGWRAARLRPAEALRSVA
ncbi:ABC transporter permease [Amnibacterium sp.]|uniref:ABC transporter permease n=1 Tax=Amnibacterium sp. TaxID=1872496 RepID=UPI002611AD3B|nr:ABC transporter permease [Amnibacterium sp.]